MSESQSASLDLEGQVAPQESSSFGDILSQFEESHRVDGDGGRAARQGTVVSVAGDSIFLDIGLKIEGVLPAGEFRDPEGNVSVQAGDTLPVTITGRNPEGYYVLSKLKVERTKDWSSLEKAFADKRSIGGVVTEIIKGGFSVDVGARAFMPASRSGARDQAEMEKLVGQEIQCRVIKLDVADEDVVVDRRAVLEEEEAKERQRALAEIQEGAVVAGTVRSLAQFGAFVDLGGFDGLLHVADMAWHRVGKPSDVLSEGDSVQVKILKVDRAARRISLGLKQLQLDPWTLVGDKYKTGERVRGKVTRTADFGAFVELEPGVEGLIHLSEMSWSKKARQPKEIVNRGESVEVVVLSVNAADRRIGLGLKQALGDPWEEVSAKYPVGAVIEGPVVSLTNFGAFVEMGEGIEGMIHISDITREKRLNHPKEVLTAGKTVRAAVVEVDREKRRIRLSMKQLEPTTSDEYIAEHNSGDMVSGRLVEVRGGKAKVELGEGVYATCRFSVEPEKKEEAAAGGSKPDLNALTAMLSAKWKQGKGPASSGKQERAQAGQIRTFRIVLLDPGSKKIEVELAE